MTTTRRLAAILAADVVGYSAAMERDEEGTAAAVRALRRKVIEPSLAEHQGRLIKTTGDGFLAEFASPIAALKCALAIQQRPAESDGLRLRIGLNLGDVIIEEGGDVLGEGVNIAARLEGLAEPGGILISGKIYGEVDGKVEAIFEDLGEQKLKNIAKPVRSYVVRPGAPGIAPSIFEAKPLPLPDKPSIAVLPFQNMSGDPEQEYFADGMVEEIITALSRFKSLFVIARNSSFTYKGKAVDIKQVGRELGVRYVLEGSVRKAGSRIRIAGQLVDAISGTHVWSDRFDGTLEQVFELQDSCAAAVVNAVAPRLEDAEIERARQKPTEHLGAYDHYLRGLADLYRWERDANEAALRGFRQSISLDPRYASAYAAATLCHVQRKANAWASQPGELEGEVFLFSERAAELGKADAECLAYAGAAHAYFSNRADRGAGLIARALAINPNFAPGWHYSGWVHIWTGQPDIAIQHLHNALRLNPRDPLIFNVQSALAHAYFYAQRYPETVHWAKAALVERPVFGNALRMLAAGAIHCGHAEDAAEAIRLLRIVLPELRVSNVKNLLGPYSPPDVSRYEDALRLAGLPE
jgi:adenylate cyclase